ncbi:hypothetical protein [Larkinella terrae]|uniref:Uncharacterized protein n=1 Tax=Larkinella terrae TaxID=2025311 RepID=A0A7K0EEW2_9BACT|nr:hypothetical protein [Larkinella terrae]MRS59996.1 hypothetical protein [Larkinella terrae]
MEETRTAFRKPYLISWLTSPAFVFTGLLFSQRTFDLQLYDTYFVISNPYFVLVGSAFLLAIGFGYWLVSLTGKTLNRTLTVTHLLLTIGVLILVELPLLDSNTLAGTKWLALSVVVFLVGQCAYGINMVVTLMRR